MAGIFISYRRGDSAGHAGRLFDRLREQFGPGQVFMDVEGIAPGDDFVKAIDRAISNSDVVLVMLGAQWLTLQDAQGQRRLDDPGDFVRIEVDTALRRNKVVIPVLVENAVMPKAEDLPTDLAPLATRNAIELSDTRWDSDVAKLVQAVRTVVPHFGKGTETRSTPWLAAAGVAVLAIVGMALWWWQRPAPTPLQLTQQPQTPPQREGALDFGTVHPSKFFTQTFRVTNEQAASLVVTDARIDGDQQTFRVDATHCKSRPLAQGEQCLLEVQFRPREPGDHSAEIVVRDNLPDSPWRIALRGRGAVVASDEARLRADTRALAFASQIVGQKSEPQRLVVSNGETTAARNFRYGVVGEDQDDFIVERECDRGWLERSERCELMLAFVPTGIGVRRAKMSFEFYGRASPLIVELTGVGTAPGARRGEAAPPELPRGVTVR